MYNKIRWEECALGKKLYTKENISKAETERLGIPELVVLKTNSDDVGLEVVHRRYFEDEKLLCPACRSSKTRCSKIVDRKLKDLLWLDEDHKTFQIISLLFHQRYMRCDNCRQSVFPEPTEFGEKGCKFTNRLSDALADGTFQFSYKKVCQHYGVPASTASVSEIMRRRIQYRESLLPPVRTPHIISVVEVVFFGERYPAVLGVWDGEVYCLDILRDSSEETCGAFLKTLNANQVETIYVDPVDSLFNAVNQYFPMASIVVTDEAIRRYARNAMLDIIHSDGKRFPVVHKDRRLTVLHRDLDDRTVIPRIKEGMKSRPRLQQAYYRLEKTYEGAIELESKPGSWKPTQPKRAGGQKDRTSPLDEIIQRINEEFYGEFTDADRVMVDTLYQKMRKDSKAKKAAKTEDRQVYERSLFPGIFDTTAQEAYMENTAAYEQLFLDADKYQAVMRALADRLYKELHDDK